MPFLVIVSPVKGEYCCEIEDVGALRVGAGESLIVPAGIRHKVGIPQGGYIHCAHIQFSLLHSIDIFRFFETPYHIVGKTGRLIGRCAKRLSVCRQQNEDRTLPDVIYGVELNKTAYELLSAIGSISNISDSHVVNLQEMTRIGPALRYIEEHFNEPLTRNDLAQVVNLSPTRFHYVFKAATGYSPVAYLSNTRIKRAQLLLVHGDLPVSEIAFRVGYPDIYHFSKAFKNRVSESPLNYRKRIQASLG